MDRAGREPSRGWLTYPNLQRRPRSPNAGRGRLQTQVRRAFTSADVLSSTTIYDWCFPRNRRHAYSQAMRWSIRRILDVRCEPVGRAPTIGRPWLWRLKTPAAEALSATAH
jgi:hypothetical protein